MSTNKYCKAESAVVIKSMGKKSGAGGRLFSRDFFTTATTTTSCRKQRAHSSNKNATSNPTSNIHNGCRARRQSKSWCYPKQCSASFSSPLNTCHMEQDSTWSASTYPSEDSFTIGGSGDRSYIATSSNTNNNCQSIDPVITTTVASSSSFPPPPRSAPAFLPSAMKKQNQAGVVGDVASGMQPKSVRFDHRKTEYHENERNLSSATTGGAEWCWRSCWYTPEELDAFRRDQENMVKKLFSEKATITTSSSFFEITATIVQRPVARRYSKETIWARLSLGGGDGGSNSGRHRNKKQQQQLEQQQLVQVQERHWRDVMTDIYQQCCKQQHQQQQQDDESEDEDVRIVLGRRAAANNSGRRRHCLTQVYRQYGDALVGSENDVYFALRGSVVTQTQRVLNCMDDCHMRREVLGHELCHYIFLKMTRNLTEPAQRLAHEIALAQATALGYS